MKRQYAREMFSLSLSHKTLKDIIQQKVTFSSRFLHPFKVSKKQWCV